MSTAATIRRFLESHHVASETMPHAHTATALGAAEAAHVQADSVAKAVMVADELGLMMAVVPASHQLKMSRLQETTGRRLHLVPEQEFAARFADCEVGAIPPIGEAYGVEMVWDDCLGEQTDIYFEAGDHKSLLHIASRDFVDLVRDKRHGCISVQR